MSRDRRGDGIQEVVGSIPISSSTSHRNSLNNLSSTRRDATSPHRAGVSIAVSIFELPRCNVGERMG